MAQIIFVRAALVDEVYALLTGRGYQVTKRYLKKKLLGHPNYPTLLSAVDTIEDLGIDYKIIELGQYEDFEFGLPALVHYHNKSIGKIRLAKSLKVLKSLKRKGPIILIEIPKKSISTRDIEIKDNVAFPSLRYIWLAITGLTCLYLTTFELNFSIILYSSILGFIVSVMKSGLEYGHSSYFFSYLCNGVNGVPCSSLPTNKKFLYFFSLAEVSMIFFFTYIILLFTDIVSGGTTKFSIFLSVFAKFAAPIIVVLSLLTQLITKRWCVLCLIINFSLALIFFAAYSSNVSNEFHLQQKQIIIFASLFTILSLVLAYLRRFAIYMNLYEEELIKHERLFHEKGIVQKIDTPSEPESNTEIILGSKAAPNEILLVLSPNCEACHSYVRLCSSMLTKYPSQVRINIKPLFDRNDINRASVSQLIEYFNKYSLDISNISEKHLFLSFKWIKKHEVSQTPTLFLNNMKMTDFFGFEDLITILPTKFK